MHMVLGVGQFVSIRFLEVPQRAAVYRSSEGNRLTLEASGKLLRIKVHSEALVGLKSICALLAAASS